MESNDHGNNSQKDCNKSFKNDDNDNRNKNFIQSGGQENMVEYSTSNIKNKSAESLLKLTERRKTIGDKLASKRNYLLQQEKQLLENEDALKDNYITSLKALQTMSNKTVHNKEKTSTIAETHWPNDVLANVANLPNGIVSSRDAVKPLYQYSKEQLENLVEGFQLLIHKLTSNNKRLKCKTEYLAHRISGLKNFPLFNTSIGNNSSTSRDSRQRYDSDLRENEESESIQENRCNLKQYSKKSKNNGKRDTEKKRNKVEMSPTEVFVNYINSILREYLGEQQQEMFEKHMCTKNHIEDLESYALSLVQAGLGCIVEEEIRINRKNNRQAFITMSSGRETNERDGIVLIPVARRYAFDGDIVRAFVLNTGDINNISNAEESLAMKKEEKLGHSKEDNKNNSISLGDNEDFFNNVNNIDSSPETDNEEITDVLDTSTAIVPENCPKAFVIRIVKQTELREIVGSISFLKLSTLNSKHFYKLKPHDMTVPMIYIPKELCQEDIKNANKEDICGMLYIARVLETDINGHCIGELLQPIGKKDNLQAETKAILLHNGFKNIKPYEQKFHDMFEEGPLPIQNENDLKSREDLRKKCVFTIDPLTAKDLDDAVSVEKLNDKEYEVGVHISDVSHFLEENSELDNLVKERATSIYLVNEVIHMLPLSLCFKCSLLPGEDKYAFSVFWRWHTEKEEFSAPRITRSIINSCTQFAYEHAQKIIDNPDEDFDRDDFPEIFNTWSPADIKWRVLLLQQITQKLKTRRFLNGALSINNPKLRFQLDSYTGEPVSYEVEGRQDSNFLIEELMLLANQSVAKFIHDSFPDKSILRNHAPPLQKSMKALKDRLSKMGLEFDISSSKSIHESMQRLCREANEPKAMEVCLSTLLTKPMARARYYCSEGKTSDADFWHFALSIPIYTHFTSPIRRYPDIMVHRLLAAALNYCPSPQRTTDELHQLAKICNDQKFNAKNAGDESIELFFKRYLKTKQSINLKAVITDIYKSWLNVVTVETGHALTISYKLQKVLVDTANCPSFILISEKNSRLPPLKLQVFSTVDINLVLRNDKICGFFASLNVKQGHTNDKMSSKRNQFYRQSNSVSEQEENNDNIKTISTKSKKQLSGMEKQTTE